MAGRADHADFNTPRPQQGGGGKDDERDQAKCSGRPDTMGDCRVQIRYVGALATDIGHDSAGGGTGGRTSVISSSDRDGGGIDDVNDAASASCASCCCWVTTPSADTSLRQLADSILVDLEDGLKSETSRRRSHAGGGGGEDGCIGGDEGSQQQGVVSFGSGANAIITSTSTTTNIQPRPLHLYDITLHPPTNVTTTLLTHPSLIGPNSKTLHDMGWYPSARLVVCYQDDEEEEEVVKDLIRGAGGGRQVEIDEGEYNRPMPNTSASGDTSSAKMVRLTGREVSGEQADVAMGDGYRPKPSQIMAAVSARDTASSARDAHGGGDNSNADEEDGGRTEQRRKRASEQRMKEKRRTARLDNAIRRIDGQQEEGGGRKKNKNAKVSAQVKKMLVKSRAIGPTNKSLREEDRFYVEVLVIDDTVGHRNSGGSDGGGIEQRPAATTPSYRYFSRVASAIQMASASVSRPLGNDATVELLVKWVEHSSDGGGDGGDVGGDDGGDDEQQQYRRLPNLMALHEAEEGGYLHQFDRVVVRVYRIEDDEPTKSVFDTTTNTNNSMDVVEMGENDEQQQQQMVAPPSVTDDKTNGKEDTEAAHPEAMEEDGEADESTTLSDRISQAIEAAAVAAAAAASTKGKTAKKAKKSALSERVRQMLMKSKAKGDKKNVKDSDRFYLEAVLVEESGTGELSAPGGPPSPYFFNRMASVQNILGVMGINKDDSNIRIFAQGVKDGKNVVYHQLDDHIDDDTVRFCDAEKAAKLQQFSCVVLMKRG